MLASPPSQKLGTRLMVCGRRSKWKTHRRVSSFSMQSSTRYTKADLMRLADGVRLGVTERLLTDWIQLGLIAAPSRRALGRGRGSKLGTWSQNEKDLFLTVWSKRADAPIRDLCNFPVYSWVWWGDEHVALRQVKRAMATWSSRQDASQDAAYAIADKLLADLSRTKHSAAVRDLLAQALRGRRPDIDQLRDNLRKGIGRRLDATIGSAKPIDVGADVIVELILARIAAIEGLPTVNDATWEWARFTQLRGSHAYGRDQPELANHAEFGHLFAALDHNMLVARGCVMLLTALGMALTGNVGTAGTLEDPVYWHEQGLKGIVSNTHISGRGIGLSFGVITK